MNKVLSLGLLVVLLASAYGCGGSSSRSRGKFCEVNSDPIPLEVSLDGTQFSIWDMDDDFEPHKGDFKFNGTTLYYKDAESGIRLSMSFVRVARRKAGDPEFVIQRNCVGGITPDVIGKHLPLEVSFPIVADYKVSDSGKTTVSYRDLKFALNITTGKENPMLTGSLTDADDEFSDGSLKKGYSDSKNLKLEDGNMKMWRLFPNGCGTPFQTRAHMKVASNNKSAENSDATLRILVDYAGPDRPKEGEKSLTCPPPGEEAQTPKDPLSEAADSHSESSAADSDIL